MSTVPRRRHRWRGRLLHALRVGLFAAVIWRIHDTHRQAINSAPPVPPAEVPPALLAEHFGPQARWNPDNFVVTGAEGEVAGRVLTTSPQSDHIIGFSGPTNLLIAVDADERILGVQVLSSGDTKEHVRQVVEDPRFLPGFAGLVIGGGRVRSEADGPADAGRDFPDAVSGATLTSLAMVDAVRNRLGGGLGSLRFPEPPMADDVQPLWSDAAELIADPDRTAWWNVYDARGELLGGLLRTAPAADNIVGYQGPTETLIGFDPQGHVMGFLVGDSYDNEPYVGYIRDDEWYRNSFNGQTLEDLASLDPEEAGVEGVSGATMTSLAIAAGMAAAARQHRQESEQDRTGTSGDPGASDSGWDRVLSPLRDLSSRNRGTLAVTLVGVIIGLTRLRGWRWVRLPFQLVLIGYLGFINGDLVSQALLVGWAQHGVPWRSMLGVFVLSTAAFVVPIATKHNVYCHQLCPHGAAQQWLRPSRSRQVHLPRWADGVLSCVPGGLLLLVVAVAMGAVPISLVDIEPFDAYLITIAGTATISIAIVGLLASAFIPMAYCRYGCPTGAAIEYVRRHARSDRFTRRDGIAMACLLLAWWLGG